MIECLTATLPWKGMVRKEAAKVKENTSDSALCKGCPPSFLEMAKALRKLTYHDWNKPGEKLVEGGGEHVKSDRAEADKLKRSSSQDGNKDNTTVNEVDESIVTEERNTNLSSDQDDFAKEDTLEGL
ncbi:hypothetical protein COOONC_19846 [Cooperia oncophora]